MVVVEIQRLYKKGTKWGVAGVCMVSGLLKMILSRRMLDQLGYYFLAMGLLILISLLIEKISGGTMNYIWFTLITMFLFIVGVELSESGWFDGTIKYTIWGIFLVVDWIVNSVLLQHDEILKKIFMGLITTLLNVVILGVAFFIPVLIHAFLVP